MKREDIVIGIWFTMLFVLLFISGCGVRNTSKTSTEIATNESELNTVLDTSKITSNSSNNLQTNKSVEIDEQKNIKKETVVDEPVDPTKPAIIVDSDGKKTELNNSKRTTTKESDLSDKKTKDISNVSEVKKFDQIEQKHVKKEQKKDSAATQIIDSKNTHRKTFNYNWLWLLLLIPIIYFVSRYKKRKTPLI